MPQTVSATLTSRERHVRLTSPTANAMQPTYHGFCDAFVTKLKPSGSAAVYSTYIGGSGEDAGFGIALDLAGNAYVAGWTDSEDFPTANPIQPTRGKGGGEFGSFFDAFALKLNSTGSKLVYSTYLGGSDFDLGLGIAVDPLGNAYVTGVTESDDFPTAHAIQPTHGGRADAFVTKLNSTGSRLVYSTYLGGSDFERALGIAADAVGNAYVTGLTHSANFPVVNAIQPTLGGGQFDAFVAKLNNSGSSLIYSTFLGGDGVDQGQGIAADLLGNAYLTGVTCSSNFPTANAIQPTYQGGCDAFVTKLQPQGLYSSLFHIPWGERLRYRQWHCRRSGEQRLRGGLDPFDQFSIRECRTAPQRRRLCRRLRIKIGAHGIEVSVLHLLGREQHRPGQRHCR